MGKKQPATPEPVIDIYPDYIQKEDAFKFWNGDVYKGNFIASKMDRSIVMEGFGTYRTGDKHIYKGIWKDNLLRGVDEITFPDKAEFYGHLKNMIMEGPGTYQYREDVRIDGNLTNNRLVGRLQLKDPTGHMWRGESVLEDRHVTFLPLQPFWQSVLHLPLKKPSFSDGYDDEEELSSALSIEF